ncbi:uncharacterized protein cd34 [Salarias fasciatus]|uniref:Uncharacterized LOC115407834 n=1 Tax=Salarias fasciatus TaxID=181472 RepID=A0A672GT83_SALFA|nr:uncharacterized protein LOC115407834 [Salarias fasciatus]
MATSNWRMNGLWRRMAGVLVLCTLLLSSEVICQDDTTDAPDAPYAQSTAAAAPDSTATPRGTDALTAGPTASAAPGGGSFTTILVAFDPSSQDGDTRATTAGSDVGNVAGAAVVDSDSGKNVGSETGDDSDSSSSSSSSSSGSSVFVGILVSGLLAALAITIGYCKCQRRPEKKGVKLAEEAYPVDQDNQGNTLVSVAPLNPPPETPEKPSANGESTEAAKAQTPPPTNGHSTAKAADTEL